MNLYVEIPQVVLVRDSVDAGNTITGQRARVRSAQFFKLGKGVLVDVRLLLETFRLLDNPLR